MRYASATLALVFGIGGCGEGVPASELEGTYEIVERVEGPCDGPLEPSLPSPDDRHFRLVEEEEARDTLLAYYPCTGPEDCASRRDLLRSFGPVPGGWEATLANADTGCVLSFRRRELLLTDDGVEIVQTAYRETDESLVGDDECTAAEANRRGDRMPCVSVVETRARRLDAGP